MPPMHRHSRHSHRSDAIAVSVSRESGWWRALSAGAAAGLLVGTLAALADAPSAARGKSLSVLEFVQCILGAIALYAGLATLVSSVAGLALEVLPTRRRTSATRLAALLTLGCGAVLFAELYWWTRPYLFYGRPALSPERLAAAAGLALAALVLGWLVARVLAPVARRLAGACAVLALCGVACLAADAWRGRHHGRGAIGERNRELPNVLLFVVDALRADALGCYGDARGATPNIDRLAAEGVVFENALCQAPFTWSSFGSILTGKYPRRHGLVKMKVGQRMRPNLTLPAYLKQGTVDGRALQADDWDAGAFLTGTVSHGSGLTQGFDVYFEALVGHERVEVASPWSRFRSDLLLFIFKNKLGQRFDSGLVVSEAARWIEEDPTRRLMAWVHLYSTHTPYDPDAEFRARFCDPDYDGPLRTFYAEHRYAIESGAYQLDAEDVRAIRDLYWAGVAQADRDVGRVLDSLRAAGALENTLVIVSADHGEELGEHGVWEHDWMWQTNQRVPLVMCWPGGLPAGMRVGGLVESVDILPTVGELLGLALPGAGPAEATGAAPDTTADTAPEAGAAARADPRIDGRSLVPLVRGEVQELRQHSFCENGVYISIQDHEWKLVVRHEDLADGAWDAALAREPHRRPELYDLKSDPGETRNLVLEPERAGEIARLLAALRAHDAAMPIALMDVQKSARDLEHEANLEALGYAGGGDSGAGREKPPQAAPAPEAPDEGPAAEAAGAAESRG